MPNSGMTKNVIAVLRGLLGAERSSVVRFMGSAEIYAGRGEAGRLHAVEQLSAACSRHEAELVAMIEELGSPPGFAPVPTDYQYLAYLSLEHLRPRIIEAARDALARYEAAIASLDLDHPSQVAALKAQLADYYTFMDSPDGGRGTMVSAASTLTVRTQPAGSPADAHCPPAHPSDSAPATDAGAPR